MKVVRPICCGLDVHKTLVVATIASTGEDGITSYEQRSFGTLNPDIKDLRDWLRENGCDEVCMESTGKYWIPIYNVLEAARVKVCLTHPKYVRAIKGKKTDKVRQEVALCNAVQRLGKEDRAELTPIRLG